MLVHTTPKTAIRNVVLVVLVLAWFQNRSYLGMAFMYVSNDVIWKRQNGRWDSFQQDKANLEKSKGSNLSFPTTSREFLLLHMRSHFNGSNGKKEEE